MGETNIRDVALRAGVSVASVSRALNGSANVRPATRQRILDAAAALGYVPHAGARSLSLSRAHLIGVVLPDLHGEFFSECVRGMDREASRRGYQLLLSNMHDDGEQAAEALRAMRGRVDGLLVMAPHIDHQTLAQMLSRSLPSVLINCHEAVSPWPALSIDNRAGAHAMVEHLVQNGYRNIVHVSGPNGNVDARERADGFCEAMRSHELAPRVIEGDFSEAAGAVAVRALLSRKEPFDAIFAANDMMAIGCLEALKTAGKRVPGEIAVGGFDDVPLARYLSLTTLRVHIADIGARAVHQLVEILEGKPSAGERETHVPELIVRTTTTPGRERDGAAQVA